MEENINYHNAYEKYCSGLTLDAVAKIVGSTRQRLWAAFDHRGWKMRSKVPRESQTFNGVLFTKRNNGYFGTTTGNRIYMHRYVWEFHNGPIPYFHDIHHVNENKSDNRIENLECIHKADHTSKHGFRNNQFTKNKCG